MAGTLELERPEQASSTDREILVVDDQEIIRSLLLRCLPIIGFAVTAARNGKEGLALFFKRPFDLVLTDLQMPGMDGWTLGRHIKERSPVTPVVLMTAQNSEVVAEAVKQSCIDTVLFKPFTLADLMKVFQEMLGGDTLAFVTAKK